MIKTFIGINKLIFLLIYKKLAKRAVFLHNFLTFLSLYKNLISILSILKIYMTGVDIVLILIIQI
jgi:hypothetical protein